MTELLGSVTIDPKIVKGIKKSVKNVSDFGQTIQNYAKEDTTKLLGVILYGAIDLASSDIHIEPQKEHIRLRLRLDGILQDVTFLEPEIYHNLLSRLKLLSKIKLNITEKPQDGRFTVSVGKSSRSPGDRGSSTESGLIEIRISSLPSEWGESLVMRILNPQNLMELETLGLRKDLYQSLDKKLKKPNGMIIVAGPTGSGKTTTLYAILMKIYNPGIKIITIEDPIEYHLTGVSQTQTSPEKGYSFSEGLMSIVRQDPDVILVGEMRDSATAKIAVQAALTGHLVLSTLHTNDAAGTVPRLFDLEVDLSSISSAVKVVISQRLVRKVCPECSTAVKPSSEELKEIKTGLRSLPKEVLDELPTKDFDVIKIKKTSEKGCKECNFSGYRGRKGIFELFLVDPEIEKYILTNPSVSALKEKVIKKGMVTMYQSGLIEVIQQDTTLEEVQRVVEAD